MPAKDWPPHLKGLFENLSEVQGLPKIHAKVSGTGRGRRHHLDILNKSGIVLIVACWEAYVEDLAHQAFDHLLNRAPSISAFPTKVLVLAGAELRTAKDERRIWELAGDGWRTVLIAHQDRTLGAFLDSFHTPRPERVEELFESLIGFKQLSSHWHWPKNTSSQAVAKLNALVDLRGKIAHRVSVGRYVTKVELGDAARLIQCLAAITSNRLREYLQSRTTQDPWRHVEYGSAR